MGKKNEAWYRIAADNAISRLTPKNKKPYWTARWNDPIYPGAEGIITPKTAMETTNNFNLFWDSEELTESHESWFDKQIWWKRYLIRRVAIKVLYEESMRLNTIDPMEFKEGCM